MASVALGRALIGAAVISFAAEPSLAAPHLGAPYEAGGVWFVPQADPGYQDVGLAAVYTGGAGRRTASGEAFDPEALTAAHPTLPLPGVVEVTNLATGRTITVRINDRGPYAPGRILSLTPASGRALGVPTGGSARVRVRYADVREGAERPVNVAADPAPGQVGVQVGAFSTRARADQAARAVAAAGRTQVEPLRRGDAVLYRVVIGPLLDPVTARSAQGRAQSLGYPDARLIRGI